MTRLPPKPGRPCFASEPTTLRRSPAAALSAQPRPKGGAALKRREVPQATFQVSHGPALTAGHRAQALPPSRVVTQVVSEPITPEITEGPQLFPTKVVVEPLEELTKALDHGAEAEGAALNSNPFDYTDGGLGSAREASFVSQKLVQSSPQALEDTVVEDHSISPIGNTQTSPEASSTPRRRAMPATHVYIRPPVSPEEATTPTESVGEATTKIAGIIAEAEANIMRCMTSGGNWSSEASELGQLASGTIHELRLSGLIAGDCMKLKENVEDLKSRMMSLADENRRLKGQLGQRPAEPEISRASTPPFSDAQGALLAQQQLIVQQMQQQQQLMHQLLTNQLQQRRGDSTPPAPDPSTVAPSKAQEPSFAERTRISRYVVPAATAGPRGASMVLSQQPWQAPLQVQENFFARPPGPSLSTTCTTLPQVAPPVLSPRSSRTSLQVTPRQSAFAAAPSVLATSRASSVPSLRGRGAGGRAAGTQPTLSPFQTEPFLHVPTLPPATVPTFVQPVPVSFTPRSMQPARCASLERIGYQSLASNGSAQTLGPAPPLMTPQVSRASEGIPAEPLATDALPKDGRVLSAVRLHPSSSVYPPAVRSTSRSSTVRSYVCGLPA
ncbi:unnamed protein product [Symbiodinium sp. CCMP2592]|nr:unnamed protein product [Symbiodinium sp. CCMP2592]